jgi:hypothetical protein
MAAADGAAMTIAAANAATTEPTAYPVNFFMIALLGGAPGVMLARLLLLGGVRLSTASYQNEIGRGIWPSLDIDSKWRLLLHAMKVSDSPAEYSDANYLVSTGMVPPADT